METKTLPVYNALGEKIDTIKLDESVFSDKIYASVIHQAVVAYLSNQRRGLAQTKTRGEVSGGGRKPWKQKGTGRARVGSTRSPLWRHGGVIFGPHPRDFSYKLAPKIKNLALKGALSIKANEDNLLILDTLDLQKAKTKEALKVFKNLKITPRQKTLLLLDKINKATKLACRNISFLNTNLAKDTHVYEVLNSDKLIITKDGLTDLVSRLKK